MKKCFVLVVALAFFAGAAGAAELSAKEIIKKSKEAQQSDAAIHKVEMTLVNKQGDKRVVKMVTRSKSVGGLARTVTTFLYPDETKGTKFLMVENADRDDDMRIYIPDLKNIRTISSSQRNQSYMGTDFAYGDLEALDADIGEHKITGSETVDGQDCWALTSTLDPKAGAGYSKMINWFRKDNFIPIKTEFYDKDGALKKVRTTSDIYKQGSTWVLKKMVMKDVQKNHETTIDIVASESKPVEDTYFSERFLMQTDKF